MHRAVTLLLACLFLSTFSLAQRQTFKAGVVGGLNLSQIDGDSEVGFNKYGVQLGLKGIAVLTERIHLNTELLFNQKGAAFKSNPTIDRNDYIITFNYMEVPVTFDFLFSKVSDNHYKHHFTTGIAYARLFSSNFEEANVPGFSFAQFEDELRKNEISPIFGYSYYFSPHIALDLRYSFAVTKVYIRDGEVPSNDQTRTKFLRNYYVTARISYIF